MIKREELNGDIHWLAWDKLFVRKDEGGMGFHNIFFFYFYFLFELNYFMLFETKGDYLLLIVIFLLY